MNISNVKYMNVQKKYYNGEEFLVYLNTHIPSKEIEKYNKPLVLKCGYKILEMLQTPEILHLGDNLGPHLMN